MNLEIATYLIYLTISIALTIWVAHTLHKNGRIFLVDVFHGNEPLADSVNHLLVVGFYLINLGFVSLTLKLGYEIASPKEDLLIFSRMRRRATMRNAPPPVYPDAFTPVQEA